MKSLQYGIFLLLVLLNVSCRDKAEYESQLVFNNTSGIEMEIQLFPKHENFGHYSATPNVNNGVIFYSNFKLQNGEEKVIFERAGANELPHNILTKYFNKFAYKPQNQDDSTFVTIDAKSNFHTIFSDASLWRYEERGYSTPTMFKRNLHISSTYIFDIKE